MKKLFYLLLLISLSTYSQEYTIRDGVLLSDIKSKHIIIKKARVYNKKTFVSIDYGQELKNGLSVNAIKLNGKIEKFSSILNVVNILNNYEFVQFIEGETEDIIILKYKNLK